MSQLSGPRQQVSSAVALTTQGSSPEPGTRVISLAGELDMVTAPELSALIDSELDAAAANHCLVIDMTELAFIGSSGLAALLAARGQAARCGVTLRLVCTSTAVLRPLTVTGLAAQFSIHESVVDALSRR